MNSIELKKDVNWRIPFNLNGGVKRVVFEEYVILVNLIEDKFIKLSKLADSLIQECLSSPPKDSIRKFSLKNNIDDTVGENLVLYIYNLGILTQPIKIEFENINIINDLPKQNNKVSEIIDFKQVYLLLDNDQVYQNEEWDNILKKIASYDVKKIIFISDAFSNFQAILDISLSLFKKNSVIVNAEGIGNLVKIRNIDKSEILINANSIINSNIVNTFDSIIQLKEMNIPLTVQCTYNHNNMETIPLIHEYCQLNKIHFSLTVCCPTGTFDYIKRKRKLEVQPAISILKKVLEQYLENPNSGLSFDNKYVLLPKLSCGAGKFSIAITPNGNIYPCPELVSDYFNIGSLKNSNLDQLKSKSLHLLKNANVENKEDCIVCSHKYFCGGGCFSRSVISESSIFKTDPYCDLIKKTCAKLPWISDDDTSKKELVTNYLNILKNEN